MTIEIGLMLAIVAGVLGVLGFIGGRLTAANKSGREWGEVKTDIKHIKERVDNIADAASSALEREMGERKEADRRLHARIDGHLTSFHNNTIMQ